MQDRNLCLILAAGFGTRMGEIGRVLPKVMWPVFEKSILEIQVIFAKHLGYQKIYINLHHQSHKIRELTSSRQVFSDVKWLLEAPEILDIGGAVHNLYSQPEVQGSGDLLILNADQVLFFEKRNLQEWLQKLSSIDSLLLTTKVNSSTGYNELMLDASGRFLGVRKNLDIPRNQIIMTYTGNSLVRLESLKYQPGPSSFFSSVCPPVQKVFSCDTSQLPYWDFGTKKRYYETMFKILDDIHDGKMNPFYDFLMQYQVLLPNKIGNNSYGTNLEGVINLDSASLISKKGRGIVISGQPQELSERKAIYYNGMVDHLD